MRVFVQQRGGEFPNINYYTAWLGFRELGYEAILFDEAELGLLDVGPDAVLAAEIPLIHATFNRLEIPYSPLDYIPTSLLPLAARRIWSSTLDEVRREVASGKALFAKPDEQAWRGFKGQVLRTFRDLVRTASFDPATPVWCSELVEFQSEYRVFVCEGTTVGLKHYCGDFRIFPDVGTINSALAVYQNQPAGFAIDFGVTSDGRTLIVEQNDGYSLGCYGLHHVTYARLLEARWLEIVGKPGNP